MRRLCPLILLFILCLSAVSIFEIGKVKAEGTIYIRADGTVDPSTHSIQHIGDVYTVMDNLDAFVVLERNNTFFDGAGHIIGGAYGSNQSQIHCINNITVVNTIINGDGIFFLDISNSLIANNTLNNGRGIDCNGNGNVIANNTVNSGRGISGGGNRNKISGNYLTNCNYTFVPENPPPYGIFIGGSNNTVIGNYIIGTNGTAINIGTSYDNTIVGNHIANNDVGISTYNLYLQDNDRNNIIYHNNFVNNTKNVENNMIMTSTVSVNIWDKDAEGNYWSNYNGTDNNGDRIGDTPYIIDENNQDNYPLMSQVIIPEFPSWALLLIMLFAMMAMAIIYKRKIQDEGRTKQ
jgi:hypothetical protein